MQPRVNWRRIYSADTQLQVYLLQACRSDNAQPRANWRRVYSADTQLQVYLSQICRKALPRYAVSFPSDLHEAVMQCVNYGLYNT